MRSKKSFKKKKSSFFTKAKMNKIGTSKKIKKEVPKTQTPGKSKKK